MGTNATLPAVKDRVHWVRNCLAAWAVLLVAGPAQAAPEIISAGKPVTVTTNGAWEAGGYVPADVTDGDLSCVDLATSALDGTIGWQNNDNNELGVVNVTIDLGSAYTIASIDYNMGNCMRANTWGADSITTPLGTFYPSPGAGSTGTWSSQTATGPVIASTITIQLSKTRTTWDSDWMSIGEIRIWGEPAQSPETGPEAGLETGPEAGPEPGPEPTPEPPQDASVDVVPDAAQAASMIISAGKPVTITTNGVWERGGYSPNDVTDGDLSCAGVTTSVENGTIDWVNDDYNELGIVNVTIDLGSAYTITSIDYNMGDCMRASTWGADSITTPLGTFSPSPGSGSTGVWSSQIAVEPVVASTVTIQLSKTRTAWDRDWMTIGEIRIWGEPAQLPEPGPEPAPEPSRDAGVDAPADSAQDSPATTAITTNTVTGTPTGTSTATTTVTGSKTGTGTVTGTATGSTGTGTSTGPTGTGSATVTGTATGMTATGTSVSTGSGFDAAPPVGIADALNADVLLVAPDAAALRDGVMADATGGLADAPLVIIPASDAGLGRSDGGSAVADMGAGGKPDARSTRQEGGQAATKAGASGGCGCSLGGARTDRTTVWPLLGMALLALWYRRSRPK